MPKNLWWGDALNSNPPPHTLCIISKNVNSLNTKIDYLEWKGAASVALDLRASVLCIQEPNLQWHHGITMRIKSIFQQTSKQPIHLATSNSSNNVNNTTDNSNYKLGNMFIGALGPWATRVANLGTDLSGLGRWSFIKLEGKSGKRLIILSGYWACPQQPRLGSSMYYNQQYHLLLQAGHVSPDLQGQFIMDLITQIQMWHTTGHGIILCMDINESATTTSKKSSISRLLTEMDLIYLQQSQIPYHTRPPTYNHGLSTIDVLLGNPKLIPHITATALMPSGIPENLSGNHCMVIINSDSQSLLGNHQILNPFSQTQGVNSHA